MEELSLPDPRGGARPLLDRVSFAVRAGEIVGLAGLQGSGISELLAALFGVYGAAPTGRIFLDGSPLRIRSPRASIAQGVGLLTNDRKSTGLVLGMSVTQNITLASLSRFSPGFWLRPPRERQCAETHRRAFSIKTADPSQAVSSLSGGNQQKVVMAKWLEIAPRVLLLDEPTRGVDIGAKHEIYELMQQWAAGGIAILLISSEMPELLALSDRILVIHRGRISAEMDRESATQERILHAAMSP